MSSSEDERPSILPDTLTDARHSDSTFSGLRQRRRAKPKDETPLVETLKKLDFHPKVEKGTKRRASSGGFISILGYVFILILLFSETSDYLTSEIDSKLIVDTHHDGNGRMKVNLDISFYAIPCTALSIDVLDLEGEQMPDTQHQISRTRISLHGDEIIGHLTQPLLGSSAILGSQLIPAGYCGSCYSASRPDRPKCCNTCFDLKKEYLSVGIAIEEAENSEQCIRDRGTFPTNLPKEGCRVRGHLEIRKKKGNFHVAAGSPHNQGHSSHQHHVHRIVKEDLVNFNVSHFIHQLQFGDPIPGTPAPPLQSFSFVTNDLVQIVPTNYRSILGTLLESFQYSATFHELPIDLNSNHHPLPGTFFHFDFSELRIESQHSGMSFWTYLLRICSSVGGVFVSIGLVYRIFSSILTRFLPKMNDRQSLMN